MSEKKGEERNGEERWKTTVAGGIGGLSYILIAHPFDTMKVLIQTMNADKKTPLFRAIKIIIKKERIRGLYRGFLPPLLSSIPNASIWLSTYHLFKSFYINNNIDNNKNYVNNNINNNNNNNNNNEENIEKEEGMKFKKEIAMAGGSAALIMAPLRTPQERIKCLLQTQTQFSSSPLPLDHQNLNNNFKNNVNNINNIINNNFATTNQLKKKNTIVGSVIDCVKMVYKEGGIKGIYRGLSATFLRDLFGHSCYFLTYEYIKQRFSYLNREKLPISILLAGGMAGICSWSISIPIDSLKSRLQIAPIGKYPRGIRDVFVEVAKKEGGVFVGARSLYRGLPPTLLRSFPANAACLFAYEFSLALFSSNSSR